MAEKIRTLTRMNIARRIAETESLKIQDADQRVEAVLNAIRELLMTADPEVRLELRDFGVFEVKLARAKPRARNPKTGEKVYVPPRRKTHFKPSKRLKKFLTQILSQEALIRIEQRNAMNKSSGSVIEN